MMISEAQSLRSYQFGSTRIDYSVLYRDRKHLLISVHPDRSVVVRAPYHLPDEEIQATVQRRAPWIVEQLDFFLSFEPRYTLKQYVPGESHRYLGRQYRLRWVQLDLEDQRASERCRLRGGFFEIECRERGQLEPLLKAWLESRAQVMLAAFAKTWVDFFTEVHGVHPVSLKVRALRGRWGSCSRSGKITLNPRLIHHARAEIEYVIVHELCHLVVPHHGRKFMDLLRRTLPDYEIRKERLERG